MFPFVALQADKLLGEPRNTNIPPLSLCSVLLFKIKTVKYNYDSTPVNTHSHTNSKNFCICDTLCSLQLCCQQAHVQCTITQYISITIETTVCNIDIDCYDNLTAQELMCLLTFQSNDNFILSQLPRYDTFCCTLLVLRRGE